MTFLAYMLACRLHVKNSRTCQFENIKVCAHFVTFDNCHQVLTLCFSFICFWLLAYSLFTYNRHQVLALYFSSIVLFSRYWLVHCSHMIVNQFLHCIFLLLPCFLIVGLFTNHTRLQTPTFVNCCCILSNKLYLIIIFGNLLSLNLNIVSCDQHGPSDFQHDTLSCFPHKIGLLLFTNLLFFSISIIQTFAHSFFQISSSNVDSQCFVFLWNQVLLLCMFLQWLKMKLLMLKMLVALMRKLL